MKLLFLLVFTLGIVLIVVFSNDIRMAEDKQLITSEHFIDDIQDYEAWSKLEDGMTYEQVTEILQSLYPVYSVPYKYNPRGDFTLFYGSQYSNKDEFMETYYFHCRSKAIIQSDLKFLDPFPWESSDICALVFKSGILKDIKSPWSRFSVNVDDPNVMLESPQFIMNDKILEYDHYPRFVDLRWMPVSGKYPMLYVIQVHDLDNNEIDVIKTYKSYATLEMPGTGEYSITLQAVGSNGRVSDWSEDVKILFNR